MSKLFKLRKSELEELCSDGDKLFGEEKMRNIYDYYKTQFFDWNVDKDDKDEMNKYVYERVKIFISNYENNGFQDMELLYNGEKK